MKAFNIDNFESQTITAHQNRKERDYWLNKLSGEIVKSRFPYDHKRAFVDEIKQENITFKFSQDVSSRLLKISSGYLPNLYIILTAGVVLLLAKYTGNKDIMVGTPVLKQDIKRNFINTILVIRNRVAGEMTFKEFLQHVRQTISEAAENQNYPIETLVYKLNLEFNEHDFPLFDVAVLLEDIHDKEYLHPVKPNIILSFLRNDGLIAGKVEYNALLYETSTIEVMISRLENLFHSAIINPGIEVADIEIFSEEEKKQLLKDFNDNNAYFPADRTVYHFLEKHANMNPGRTVIAYKDEHLTYRELNNWANRLAWGLKENGLKGDQCVGILLDRSPTMAACILAAWKVGCAYIPIDTNQPVQRIIEILNDSRAPILFTRSEYTQPGWEEWFDGKFVLLNNRENHTRERSTANLEMTMDMNRLAYIIYTSGSMGNPKGVMVEHIGMMNHIQAKINDLQLTGKSIIAQNASHCFDISVWQFFTTLLPGGKTIIYPDQLILEPGQFLSRLIEDQVSILEVVPSYLSVLLSILDLEFKSLDCLEYLLVTGEAVKPDLVQRWFQKFPGVKMVNAYGPTEASDDITHYLMDKAPGTGQVPIGKPLQNLNIYIVDEHMKLCPPGVKGEIVVSGVGVGRGYLNDPQKTNRAFLNDPFVHAAGKGVSLYRTGDLGCWLPDGNIEFFGRKDYQVKIRGYRIELEEIEKKLLQYTGIREAVVIEKEIDVENDFNTEPERCLCAFLAADEKLKLSEIKTYLEGILPGYMIPEYFEQIERIPLTANGKIDRKTLAKLEISLQDGELAVAENEIEKKLVEIWSEVLGIDKNAISIDSNFFHLGGHSIKATLLAAKIHKEFDTSIQLKNIFELPTIRTFSKFIRRSAKDSKHVSIEPVEKKEYYPLSSAQKRLFFMQRMQPEGIFYNLSGTYIIEKEFERVRFEEIFRELIEQHESFRTSFSIVDGEPVQRIHDEVNFQMESYHIEAGDKVEKKIEEIVKKFIRPFDLSRGPLMRLGVIQGGIPGNQYLLLLDMHHIITDYTSYGILVRDLFSLDSGEKLPPIKLHYKDYSEFKNSEKESEKIKKQEKYWLKEFEGEIPRLNFPTDFLRPEIFNYKGRIFYFDVDRELVVKIKELMLETNTTRFMVLLAVYNILLSKYTGQEDIIVGTGNTGRNQADLQNIIGMFINILGLRNAPRSDKTFRKFLEEVKEKSLNAFDNDGYQFDDLVGKLGLPRDLSRNPLFDVTIQVLDPGDIGLKHGYQDIKPYEFEPNQSQFDLILEAVEDENKINMSFTYSTTLFKESSLERIANHYIEILRQVLENRDITLGDIDISHDLLALEMNIFQEEEGEFAF